MKVLIIPCICMSSCYFYNPNVKNDSIIYEEPLTIHVSNYSDEVFQEQLTDTDDIEYDVNSLGPIDPIVPINPAFPTVQSYYLPDSGFTSRFFSNLKNNMPNNFDYVYPDGTVNAVFGNCPFVAISMYMSYLDVYWNDNIIPNIYQEEEAVPNFDDVNSSFESPGIIDNWSPRYTYHGEDLSPNQKDAIIREFISEAEDLSESSYFAYLVNLANNLGLFPESKVITSFGLEADDIFTLVEGTAENNDVLGDNYQFVKKQLGVNGLTHDDLKNGVIELVSQGIPVILGVPGHVVVAYEYSNGEIFINSGYKGSHPRDSLEETYGENCISDYYYLELSDNIPHIHNRLYKDTYSFNTSRRCSCSLASHSHRYSYEIEDNVRHIKQCRCQLFGSYEDHIFSNIELIDNHYFAICDHCNYSMNVDDTFVPIV